MADRKLDIFDLLRAADKNQFDWLSKQPEDARKEFAPLVAMRWAATVEGPQEAAYMLWMVNERVNLNLFDLAKHPDLVFKLMASCGLGSVQRHQWIAPHKRKGGANKAFDFLASLHPEANDREVNMLLSKYTKATFTELVKECGVQPNEAKDLVKAYDKLQA